MDSLSGSMAHNYYLYEYNGQLNIFPWDYNLSLGGMSMGNDADATEVVNDAIDTPGGSAPGNMPDKGDSAPDKDDPTQQNPKGSAQGKNNSSDSADKGNSAADKSSGDKQSRPSSFSGTPGQSSVSTAAKNAILYGIGFAVLIAALLVINHVKRRR